MNMQMPQQYIDIKFEHKLGNYMIYAYVDSVAFNMLGWETVREDIKNQIDYLPRRQQVMLALTMLDRGSVGFLPFLSDKDRATILTSPETFQTRDPKIGEIANRYLDEIIKVVKQHLVYIDGKTMIRELKLKGKHKIYLAST